MNNEIWKPVLDYISLYEVSNFGRVRSLKYGKVRILKPGKQTNGYLYVNLWKDGKRKHFRVHRLVWEAFNGIIPDGHQINHISENKTDCSLCNLNLMTPKENVNWGTCNQRIAEKQSEPVLQLTLTDKLIKEWPSIMEIGRNGFDQGSVSKCCNGKRKSHKGFKWMKKLPSC